jgi:hypothetical protein
MRRAFSSVHPDRWCCQGTGGQQTSGPQARAAYHNSMATGGAGRWLRNRAPSTVRPWAARHSAAAASSPLRAARRAFRAPGPPSPSPLRSRLAPQHEQLEQLLFPCQALEFLRRARLLSSACSSLLPGASISFGPRGSFCDGAHTAALLRQALLWLQYPSAAVDITRCLRLSRSLCLSPFSCSF